MATMAYNRTIHLNAMDLEKLIRKQYGVPDSMQVSISSEQDVSTSLDINITQSVDVADDKTVEQQVSAFINSMQSKPNVLTRG